MVMIRLQKDLWQAAEKLPIKTSETTLHSNTNRPTNRYKATSYDILSCNKGFLLLFFYFDVQILLQFIINLKT
jgi:hypothetical protein